MDVDRTMFSKELRDILRELADTVNVVNATIVPAAGAVPANDADLGTILPLGGGARLYVVFKTDETSRDSQQHAAAVERAARAIRSCARRWNIEDLPELSIHTESTVPRERMIARIQAFLSALCGTQNVVNAAVTLHDKIVTSATPLDELQRERVPFILKRLRAEVGRNRGESSHAEIVGDDLLAQTFWFGAAVIAFFEQPVSEDFLRHRVRMVIRELSGILPSLDDPPQDPAKVEPIPE